MGDYNNPYRPYTHDWVNRERDIRDRRNREAAWDEWSKSFGPKDSDGGSGVGGGGGGGGFGWESGEPIDPEDVIRVLFCCGLLPLLAYTTVGSVMALSWWVYVGSAILLGILATQFPKIGRLYSNTLKLGFALIVFSSLSQMVNLENRALLAFIIAASLIGSFAISTNSRLSFIEDPLHKFDYSVIMVFMLLLIIAFSCYVLINVFGIDAYWVGGWSVWLLELLAGSLFRLLRTISS